MKYKLVAILSNEYFTNYYSKHSSLIQVKDGWQLNIVHHLSSLNKAFEIKMKYNDCKDDYYTIVEEL